MKNLKYFRLTFLFINLITATHARGTGDTLVKITDEVTVYASKMFLPISEMPKSVSIITSTELQQMPVHSIQDALAFSNSVDVRKRGDNGIQSDLSIRGGSFEQSLILFDGIKINDPQTGHNNLNIPINLSNIDRIEVLRGHSGDAYGANALTGVINIVSKKHNRDNNFTLSTQGGSYGLYRLETDLGLSTGNLSQNISYSKSKSDGYIAHTDFKSSQLFYNNDYAFDHGNTGLIFGYSDKSFGANGFYSPTFKNQWEQLKTMFLASSSNFELQEILISPKISWRKNYDHYLLDFSNPTFYSNIHRTNTLNFELSGLIRFGENRLSLSSELSLDNIASNNLGNHYRRTAGLSTNFVLAPDKQTKLILSGFAYNYSGFGWKFIPGVDLSYKIDENLSGFGSFGKSFRLPTFTELYYSSPSQLGNSSLRAEEIVSYELGMKYNAEQISSQLSFFNREGSNLIDWTKESTSQVKWNANNLLKLRTRGIEFEISITPAADNNLAIKKLSFGFNYLESLDKNINYISKYLLDHSKRQFLVTLVHNFISQSQFSWLLRYQDRYNMKSYVDSDMKLTYPYNQLLFNLEITNLLNHSNFDFSSLRLPGRWIKLGADLKISGF